MMSTRFLPMSCTSPRTVASTMRPFPDSADRSICGSRYPTASFITSDRGQRLLDADVDIILANNGYDVVNIGIKQPLSAIVDAATEQGADVIGMSGLLVKSTVVMRDNLAELNSRGLADRWPVLLGGAALTRAYVEQDLASPFDGQVPYARDAFEGLRLMDAAMAVKRGDQDAQLPALRQRRVTAQGRLQVTEPGDMPARSDVATDSEVPTPPFTG